ncbi:MAG: DUF1801 domain-containing protein [Pseudomonadota bacterium]|uniref:DUF1801 domain-containing protein n=1 Tax=Polaromonas sp. TaxID=1869339 RepID=UPI0017F1ACAF|nr:DUF1801 domain-containing protein [Polaromonas sp.]MBA3593254.1 DUF1801 domain-containing protein [Polaromonas sp.]MDQ3272135.1 DUF1801 domain-containing protein [Pseudomonadota bacterium]
MQAFADPSVEAVFKACPPALKKKLLSLRAMIFEVAASTPGVGELQETLKWNEPAYLTTQSKSGSTIRIAPKKSGATQYAMYFNCQTRLVDTFRTLFPAEFNYEGNRAIVFDTDQAVHEDALRFCIAMTLTYHRNKTGVGA